MIHGDGYLVLGAAETVIGLTDSFKVVPDKRGLYTPNARSSATQPGGGARARLVAVNSPR